MSYSRAPLLMPASPQGKRRSAEPSSGRAAASPGRRPRAGGRVSCSASSRSPSAFSSSYRRLPAPSSSLDHLEVLLAPGAGAGPGRDPAPGGGAQEQLRGLNDRFVAYIAQVHRLEQRGRRLEAEVAALRGRAAGCPRLRQLFEQERRQLRARAEALRGEGEAAARDTQQLGRAVGRRREEAAGEARRREEAERALRQARLQAADAALARREREARAAALRDQLAFLRRVHEQEVAELRAQLRQAQVVPVEADASTPDLTAALKEIRGQYEALSARNQQTAEEWYKAKFADASEEVARSSDCIRQAKEELSDYRCQLQARSIEVETLRSTNESLERQLQEAEERNSEEIHDLQDTISQLDDALRTTKGEMTRHLWEYQDLLDVKMALDIEIAAYRKLLEGEETRLNTVSSNSSLLGFGYPFSSSPLVGLKGFLSSTVAVRKDEKGEAEESPQGPRDSGELKAAEGEDSSGDEKSETSLGRT